MIAAVAMNESVRQLSWVLEDEARGLQYHLRVYFEPQEYDPGDWTTPPSGGGVHLVDLKVTQVRRFNERGMIANVELGATAEKYADRVWELLESDRRTTRRIEEACLERSQPAR